MSKLKDVAELSGVSLGTVDRIIHNRGRFSEDTAKRVKDAMKKLSYKPDIRARNLSLSRKCHICVIMPYIELNSRYWSLPHEGMTKALKELSASHVTADFFYFDETKTNIFRSTLKAIKPNIYDAFISAPLITSEFDIFYKNIFKDKPVIFFDSDIPGSPRSSYVGQKSIEAGNVAAKLMNQMTTDRIKKILIITTDSRNTHLIERIDGFIQKSLNPVKTIELPADNKEAKKILKHISPDFQNEFCGIYVTYSSCNLAVELIDKLKTKIPLIGFDLVPQNVEYLRNGIIDYILTQRPIDQGYQSIMTLYRSTILGHKIPSEQLMPIDIIAKENLESHLRIRQS